MKEKLTDIVLKATLVIVAVVSAVFLFMDNDLPKNELYLSEYSRTKLSEIPEISTNGASAKSLLGTTMTNAKISNAKTTNATTTDAKSFYDANSTNKNAQQNNAQQNNVKGNKANLGSASQSYYSSNNQTTNRVGGSAVKNSGFEKSPVQGSKFAGSTVANLNPTKTTNSNLLALNTATSASSTALSKVNGKPAEPGVQGSLPIGDGSWLLLFLACSYIVFRKQKLL